MNVEEVQRLAHADRIEWTRHVTLRLIQRGITPDEVLEAVATGVQIEDYPSDTPYPSGLIMGRTSTGRVLHLVCSIDESDTLWIITAYQPADDQWNEDYTQRRAEP